MRRQDEILLLYSGQNPLARKFLLSQVEDLGAAFDADETLEFLVGQLADKEPSIRAQALHSLCRFLPAFIRRRYALSSDSVSAWTQYGDSEPGSLTRDVLDRVAG